MKAIATLALALILGCGAASAQLFSTTQGKVFTYHESIPEHKLDYKSTTTIESVNTDANGVINVVVEEKEPIPGQMFGEIVSHSSFSYNPADKVTTYVMLTGEEFKTSMVNMIKDQASAAGHAPTEEQLKELSDALKVRGELVIPMPADAAQGTEFPKSILSCSAQGQRMTMTISKGTYQGMEEIETPAGKFNCYKIQYQYKQAMGGPVDTSIVTRWFAEGVGVVKSVSTDKKGNLNSESVLESISE